MTPNELRELLARATPGPWEWSENGNILGHMPNGYDETREVAAVYSERDDDLAPLNARLIVAAVNALPALLDERDALAAEVAGLRAAPEATIGWQAGVGMTLESCRLSSDLIGKRVALVELPAPPVAGGGEQSTEGEES